MSNTTRQVLAPTSSTSRSSAGASSPFFQLSELMLTPNPSMVWNVCVPLIASAVPDPPLTVTVTGADVTVFPLASRPIALSVCEPLAAVTETE